MYLLESSVDSTVFCLSVHGNESDDTKRRLLLARIAVVLSVTVDQSGEADTIESG